MSPSISIFKSKTNQGGVLQVATSLLPNEHQSHYVFSKKNKVYPISNSNLITQPRGAEKFLAISLNSESGKSTVAHISEGIIEELTGLTVNEFIVKGEGYMYSTPVETSMASAVVLGFLRLTKKGGLKEHEFAKVKHLVTSSLLGLLGVMKFDRHNTANVRHVLNNLYLALSALTYFSAMSFVDDDALKEGLTKDTEELLELVKSLEKKL